MSVPITVYLSDWSLWECTKFKQISSKKIDYGTTMLSGKTREVLAGMTIKCKINGYTEKTTVDEYGEFELDICVLQKRKSSRLAILMGDSSYCKFDFL